MAHTLGPLGHRQVAPLRDDPVILKQIERYVEMLLDLEARTHPVRPQKSPATDSKELDSLSALMYAEALLGLLLGWAWDHRIGLVINKVAGFPWPEGDETAKKAADADDNEMEGAAYRDSLGIRGIDGPGKSDLNRRILAELTGRYAPVPAEFGRELSTGLRALDMGEVLPLLERTKVKGRRARSYSLWQGRLSAVEHVHFFLGCGGKKSEAITKVADALGVETDLVAKWEKTGLPKYFGETQVNTKKANAYAAGRYVRAKRPLDQGTEDDPNLVDFHLAMYGAAALERTVRDYKDIPTTKTAD